MALEHRVTQSDTVYSLARDYLGAAERWNEIVEYNRLQYPYLVGSHEERDSMVYSMGYLTVGRSSFSKPTVIKKGWQFKTKPYLIGGRVSIFEVIEDTVLPAGSPTAYIPIRSLEKGSYGNVDEGMVTELGKGFEDSNISLTFVRNEKPIAGGSDARFLSIGDTIYIPDNEEDGLIRMDLETMMENLGGEDLALFPTPGGRMSFGIDGFGNIATVSGVENIEQAINSRLTTEKGELPLHPEYGTNLASIIGNPQLPYMLKLAEVEIYEALSYEDRIKDVEVTDLFVDGTVVHLEIEFTPAYQTRRETLGTTLNFGTGR